MNRFEPIEFQVMSFQCAECRSCVDIVEDVKRNDPPYLTRCPNPACGAEQSLEPTECTDFDEEFNRDLKRQHGYTAWGLSE